MLRNSVGTLARPAPVPPPAGARSPARAYRLPPDAYTSRAWLAREQEHVFEATWQLVAAIDDLPAPGDVVDVQVGRFPLVLAHTGDGLRAFHNICRHRGMALVCGPTHAGGRMRCPYHGWEFASDDGAAVRIPQRAAQFGDVDLADLGLKPASVAEWEGLVFAFPGADPPSFEEFLSEFPTGLGSYRPGHLRQVARVDIVGRFNWKLFVENHIDVYHLWYLHEGTLGDYDHPRFQHTMDGPHWYSYEPLRSGVPAPGTDDGAIGHLSERDRLGIGAHLLFPNMTLATTASFLATYAAFPTSPTETRVELRIRAEDPDRGDDLLAAARAFIDEDIAACERVQAVVGTPGFGVGPLAREHEAPITAFQDALLTRLGHGATGTDVPLPRAVGR